MATLLIDIRDVTTQPITGDTVTLTAPAPRPATGGGVTRPFNRLVTLVDGKATVEVDPGPLRVTFHDGYGREVVIDTRVPDDGDVFTLRDLVVAEIGDLDDVPGIREALDGKADVEHEHNIGDIVDLDDVLDGKAPTSHDHVVADITDLSPVLSDKADVNHRHTINDVDDLTWSLDQKVNVTDLRESVKDFSAEYLARIVDGAPESLDTLREVAAEFERQDDAIEAVFTELGKRAMKSHTHAIGDVSGLQAALDGKATTTELSEGLLGKADSGHRHYADDIGDNANLDDYVDAGDYMQSYTAHARNGVNYPIGKAGYLEVLATSSQANVLQRYVAYDQSGSYFRTRFGGNWSPWVQISEDGHRHTVDDVAGFDAALSKKADVWTGYRSNRISGTGLQTVTGAWGTYINPSSSGLFAINVEGDVSKITLWIRNNQSTNIGRYTHSRVDGTLERSWVNVVVPLQAGDKFFIQAEGQGETVSLSYARVGELP